MTETERRSYWVYLYDKTNKHSQRKFKISELRSHCFLSIELDHLDAYHQQTNWIEWRRFCISQSSLFIYAMTRRERKSAFHLKQFTTKVDSIHFPLTCVYYLIQFFSLAEIQVWLLETNNRSYVSLILCCINFTFSLSQVFLWVLRFSVTGVNNIMLKISDSLQFRWLTHFIKTRWFEKHIWLWYFYI